LEGCSDRKHSTQVESPCNSGVSAARAPGIRESTSAANQYHHIPFMSGKFQRSGANIVVHVIQYDIRGPFHEYICYKTTSFRQFSTCEYHHHHNRFYGHFSATTQVSRCQKRTSGLYGAREVTEADTPTIRLVATPSGLTSALVHHPHVFRGRMPFLPPNRQCQSTEGNM